MKVLGRNLFKIGPLMNVVLYVKALEAVRPLVWAKEPNPRNLAFYTTTKIFNQHPDWEENATKS